MSDCPESVFFFVWWGDGYTCVILTKDSPQYELERGGPDEEGYYYINDTYTLTQNPDNDEWIVRNEHYTDGRDCDGRLESNNNCWCKVSELRMNKSRCGCFPTPNWRDDGGSQRDHSAEAMNY